jgi:YVTN family beta-propeller protein
VAVNQGDDTVYVANAVDNDLSVIDGRTFAALPGRVAVGIGPDSVAVNQEDDTVYVTNETSGTVSVINGRTNTVDDTITVGTQLKGVAIDQADDTVYVAERGAGFVAVIDGRTNSLDDTITVDTPYAIAVDNAGTNAGLVYVTGASTLSVVARVSPSLGSLYGAADDTATITLTVPNLAAGVAMDDSTITSVSFDDTAATNLTAGAGNTWTLTVPAGTGTVPVTVTFNGGLEASAGSFTYGSPPAPNPPSPNPPPPVPASAPLDVTATAGDASATVTWKAPASPGDYPVTSYRAIASPGGRTCLVAVPALTCEVTGLTNGTAYTLSVQALTGAGWGAASSPSNAVTPRAVPKSSITITGTRDGQRIMVSGTATDLAGKTLRPWVRFPGQTTYTEGTAAITPAADGSFTWSRKTGKKTYVYIAHEATKSNTVSVPAR